MPYHVRVEELLAGWREAERRHASAAPGTPEFERTRLEVEAFHKAYREAVDQAEDFELSDPRPVPQMSD